VNEPTAAALAYGLDKKKDETTPCTTSAALAPSISPFLKWAKGVIEVKSTNGDTHLGRDNLDQRIVEWLIAEVQAGAGSRPRIEGQRDGAAAPEGRRGKSQDRALDNHRDRDQSSVRDRGRSRAQAPGAEADARQARNSLWKTCWIARSSPARRLSRMPASAWTKIDEVVLVGGQTRMPKIQEMVKKMFGREPHRGVNPARSGRDWRGCAGGRAGRRSQGDLLLLGRDALDPVDRDAGGVANWVIRNATQPFRTKKTESFFDGCGFADGSRSPRVAGRACRWRPRQPYAGASSNWGHSSGARGVPQIGFTSTSTPRILTVTAKDKRHRKTRASHYFELRP